MSHPENELDNILHALRDEHRAIQAPAALEERLARQAQQARAHTSHTPGWLRSHAWGLSFALLAIAAAVAGLLVHTSPHAPQQVQIHTVPAPTQQPPQTAQTQVAPQPPAVSPLTAQSTRRPRKPNPSVVQDASAERFVRLPASEGLPEPMQPSFIRTRILTSSLPQYGIDVPPFAPPQTVLAEFVVGEDGLPRAIRLIR